MIGYGPYEQDAVAWLHRLDPTGVSDTAITVRLTYDPCDPCAVQLLFPSPSGPGIRWIIARDLLIRGVECAAGEGDVRVATYGLATGDLTVLTLSAPDGMADFTFTTDDLIRFLLITEELVPVGSESRLVQAELDEEVQRLGTADHD